MMKICKSRNVMKLLTKCHEIANEIISKCIQSYSKSLLNQNISQNYVFDTNTNTNINNNMKIIMLYIIRSNKKEACYA